MFEERQISILDNKLLSIPDEIALPWTLQHLMAIVETIKTIEQSKGDASDWRWLYERVAEEV